VLTTGTGEAASDSLTAHNLPVAAGVGLSGLITGLVVQLHTRTYRPWAYWVAVPMVAEFATMAADAVHVAAGVPHTVTSLGYALTVVFVVWHRREATLGIQAIATRARDAWYWVAVLATFALGTAVGDLSAITAPLGYLDSVVLYATMMTIPLTAWRAGTHPIIVFWTGHVLTRPLGASVADWSGKPPARTGLGLGDGPVPLTGTALIITLVTWTTRTARARPKTPAHPPEASVDGARHGIAVPRGRHGAPMRPRPTPGPERRWIGRWR
jgi:uncharacterized membrane-anchored protein